MKVNESLRERKQGQTKERRPWLGNREKHPQMVPGELRAGEDRRHSSCHRAKEERGPGNNPQVAIGRWNHESSF